MPKRRRNRGSDDDAVDNLREWQDHRYDFDYYARTGRRNPMAIPHLGFIFLVIGGMFALVGVVSVFSGRIAYTPLLSGIFLLVAGFGLLRRKGRRSHAHQGQSAHQHKRKHKALRK